jgi:hypothetical protein
MKMYNPRINTRNETVSETRAPIGRENGPTLISVSFHWYPLPTNLKTGSKRGMIKKATILLTKLYIAKPRATPMAEPNSLLTTDCALGKTLETADIFIYLINIFILI